MPRPKTYHHGSLRESLVDAAIAQARKAGIASITMRAVAQRAGVTPAAAYHHFASKEHLLAACAERAFAAMFERLEPAHSRAGSGALDRLDALGRAYIEFFAEHPEQFRIVFGAHVRLIEELIPEQSAGRRARALLVDTAADVARELGGALSTEQVVQAAWSMVAGAVALIAERELAPSISRTAISAMIDTVTTVLRRGLEASARPSTRTG